MPGEGMGQSLLGFLRAAQSGVSSQELASWNNSSRLGATGAVPTWPWVIQGRGNNGLVWES